MAHIWIVHRDPRWRDALRQLAEPVPMVVGDPAAPIRFEQEPPPRAVLLGVAGDFEVELEFAHRFAPRLATALWVLLARERDRAEVERLFDALPVIVVPLVSDAATLRRRLAAALARRPATAISTRTQRDALGRRFSLWTRDLELSALLAATDPARAHLPILVRGEPGTGRELVARYLHQATARDPGEIFVTLREAGSAPAGNRLTVCIEDADQLDLAGQNAFRDWIEHGPLAGTSRPTPMRWMATAGPAGEDALDPRLRDALAGHEIHLPPLRERPAAIDALVAATGRAFTPEALAHLHAHPWPGNLRELDAVLRRTVAARRTDPIPASDLRFGPAILDLEDLELPDEAPATIPERNPTPNDGPASGGAEGAGERSEPQASEAHQARPPTGNLDPAPAIHRLSSAIAHEVANPLVGIRTYASMLPSRFDDPEFRVQFAERVEADTQRIEAVVETLVQLGEFGAPAAETVDVSAMLAAILEHQRPQIRDRRLVVLEELDRANPLVRGDAAQLGFAFARLLESALAWVPPRGDLYVATRHRPATAGRGAALHIELRMRGTSDGLGFAAHALAVAVAEAVVRAHGGSLTSESTIDATGLRIELPAP